MKIVEHTTILLLKSTGQSLEPATWEDLFTTLGAFDIMVYRAIFAVSQALTYFRKYQEREFRLAQLQSLKTQLQPHFLFNTLNAISELTYESPEIAERTITQLSDLLRLSLKSDKEQEVKLKDELNLLEKYVEIQRTLMQERLTVRWEIDPDTFEALVPTLILQPLVENSIRHGLDPLTHGGLIEVWAQRQGGMLHLAVRDNGVGFSADAQNSSANGVGLTNTRARLGHLYGRKHHFDLSEMNGRGWQSTS
jgi:sensor histidine kinase YesM